jgi:ribosome biogenesis GTPase A
MLHLCQPFACQHTMRQHAEANIASDITIRRVIAGAKSSRCSMFTTKPSFTDLVPQEVAQQWLTYFRQELPTIAFKAATKKSGTIAQGKLPARARAAAAEGSDTGASGLLATSECLGADALVHLLKNYTRNAGIKTAVTVGVVGMPNVGKSSLINSLKRSRVAAVGNTPGVTTGVQEVQLDKSIRLLDSPGVVFAAADDDAAAALRNAVKVCQTGAQQFAQSQQQHACFARCQCEGNLYV